MLKLISFNNGQLQIRERAITKNNVNGAMPITINLLYTGKPDISFKFSSDKNIISKRENLKIKESYVRQISNRIRTNYYLKKGNN